jgi:uncharacterized membrane protein
MANPFFSDQDQERIISAIEDAELKTSGEIRVHVDHKCSGDPVQKAFRLFRKLGMDRTDDRNGVLFYIATDDRKLAIIGDKGIHEKVQSGFWDRIKEQMIIDFKQSSYADGLIKGIEQTGEHLADHFPRNVDDRNELSNEMTFGK